MTEPLGTATEYDHLIEIARRRMAERLMTFDQLDTLSGMPKGYSSKLLAPGRANGRDKRFGPTSFGAVFGALGIVWMAMPDAEAVERLERRSDHHCKKVDSSSLTILLKNPGNMEIFRLLGQLGGRAAARVISKEDRRRNGERGARLMWRRRKWWERRRAAV